MRRFAGLLGLSLLLVWTPGLSAQQKPKAEKADKADPKKEAEEEDLQRALAETGGSPVEFTRALESHLAKYPDSERRPELERAIVRQALENDDTERLLKYGESVLARNPDDLQLVYRMSRILVKKGDKESLERGLKYARRHEELLHETEKEKRPARWSQAKWRDELDKGLARSYVTQARAEGLLGHVPEAVALARKSYETVPTAEGAREKGRWLEKAGQDQEAVASFADAFIIADSKNTDADRAQARARVGEIYRKLKGNETGLGDLVLEAYDRTTAQLADRRQKLNQLDPNTAAGKPGEFTLSGLGGDKLSLSSLQGKVVIMDFWATWCGPCRAQHPLYEEVKKRFESRPDVVFLSVNTDEERDGVPAFLDRNKWDKKVYFEDGLSEKLEISSIPTTIILNRRGEVVNRMAGYIPGRFVDMLSERIEEALKP